MKGFNTNTDWARNKLSASIIYTNADGSTTEITLEGFLADSPDNTAAMFTELKALSDELFHEEDNAEGKRLKYELPLYNWSEKYASETLESQLIGNADDDAVQAYLSRRKQMLQLVPTILDKLTETQRRRFLLHKVNLLTTRRIAALEGATQQSIFESISRAEKKIQKYLLKLEANTLKHPVKPED